MHRGTWLASSVIAVGLALPMAGWPGASSATICTRITTVGIALLIVLPMLRVVLMLMVFVCERDFRFSAIAMLVLAIIVLASVLGAPKHITSPKGETRRATNYRPASPGRFVDNAISVSRASSQGAPRYSRICSISVALACHATS
jgi:hypothetical protein